MTRVDPREHDPSGCERVVVVTTSYPAREGDPSGHFVETEVRSLEAAGHAVTVIAPRPATGAEARSGVVWIEAGSAFGWPGVVARVRERPWRAVSALRFVLGARRALRRELAVGRVVAHFAIPSAWPIASAARGARLEVVVHGSDARLIARLPGFVRRRIARALESADVRATSTELRDVLGRALGFRVFSRTRVGVAPVDVTGTPGREAARRALGVGNDERLVVVTGRLVPSKRIDVALAAARLAGASRLVVVGDGPERSALERAFTEVEFTGLVPRSKALAWLSAADVLVSASEHEGSPSVVREARALGTKVVAVAAGDLASLSARDAGVWVMERVPA